MVKNGNFLMVIVSGKDRPGITAQFTRILMNHNVEVVDIEQASLHNLLGLYLVLEQPDGRLLDEHDLPDGNLYKMEGGTGELNNQGPTHPTDKSDLDLFLSTYLGGSANAPWWEQNLDLDDYYSFRAVMMGRTAWARWTCTTPGRSSRTRRSRLSST